MKKHYLVDTNVIIDMLLDREDADAACAVFDGAERGEYYLHICALSFTTMFYSLRKILSIEDRINALTQLKEALEVAVVDSNVPCKYKSHTPFTVNNSFSNKSLSSI